MFHWITDFTESLSDEACNSAVLVNALLLVAHIIF